MPLQEMHMAKIPDRVATLLAAFFGLAIVGSGVVKLAGQSSQVAAFAALGLPAWFRALVGTFEVLGGLLVIVPAARPVGSLIVSTILVGALWAHTAYGEWPRAVAVIVLLTVFLSIFRASRRRAIQFLEGV
jgi:uncharacterized membrane protein YphA (DoxX/SURF4 family)